MWILILLQKVFSFLHLKNMKQKYLIFICPLLSNIKQQLQTRKLIRLTKKNPKTPEYEWKKVRNLDSQYLFQFVQLFFLFLSFFFLSFAICDIYKWLDILVFSDKDGKPQVPSHSSFTVLILVGYKRTHTAVRKEQEAQIPVVQYNLPWAGQVMKGLIAIWTLVLFHSLSPC